jgi:hypothetical protein
MTNAKSRKSAAIGVAAALVASIAATAPAEAQQPRPGETTAPRTDTRPPARPGTRPPARPPETKPATKPEPAKPAEPPFEPLGKVAVLQGLDKVTARTAVFEGNVGASAKFGSLEIVIRRCERSRPEQKPERAAFVEVYDIDPASRERRRMFSGWMFASNPAISALEHPVYDVWVKDCK